MKKIVVAIDGPAGAGKSTIAKLAAEKLGYAYIDTGAMYRSVAWKFLQTGKPFDEDFISGLSKTMLIDFKPEAKNNRVFVDGTEVTDAIRTPEVTAIVSRVAAIGAVREAMVDQQRRMGEAGGVLMDGRDIGTVVFPNAQLKIFLTASVEERARRRYEEMVAKGQQVDLQQLQADIAERDKQEQVYPNRRGGGTPFYRNSELNQLGVPVIVGIYGTNPAGGGYHSISPTILIAHQKANMAVGGAGIVGGMNPKGYVDQEGAEALIKGTEGLRADPPGS